MKEKFKKYLVMRGYKERTPSGNPSTAYDYVMRIERVCEWEHLEWSGLACQIDEIIPQYDRGGNKEIFGNRSHRAVINALLRFQEFIKQSQ